MSNHPNFTTPGVNQENHHAPNILSNAGSGEDDASVQALLDLTIEHSVTGEDVRRDARAMDRLRHKCRQAILAHGAMDLYGETASRTMLYIPAFAENRARFHHPEKIVALFLKLAEDRRRNIEEIDKLDPDREKAIAMHSSRVLAAAKAEMRADDERRKEAAEAKAAAKSAPAAASSMQSVEDHANLEPAKPEKTPDTKIDQVNEKQAAEQKEQKRLAVQESNRAHDAKLAKIRAEVLAKKKVESENPAPTDDSDGDSPVEAEDDDREYNAAGLPIIYVKTGELGPIVDQIEQALISRQPNLYQRGNNLVTPGVVRMRTAYKGREIAARRLVPVDQHNLTERISNSVEFKKWDGRKDDFKRVDANPYFARVLMSRTDLNLPQLVGMINAPTLRPDASILDMPGYDEETALLYDPMGVTFPEIPQNPTKEDAAEALLALKGLIVGFPFKDRQGVENPGGSADRSVALSAMLTAVIRTALSAAPLHATTAPAAGSGKSYLIDIAATIATGQETEVISQGNPEEFEKRLVGALLAGQPIVSIDNCEQPIGGDLLCQALTQPTLNLRPLGVSKLVEVPTTSTMFFATGNNLRIAGDMTRRVLLCSIDSGEERPELRAFSFNPLQMAKDNRPKYLVAALTILRAYIVAGKPVKLRPLASFEQWSGWVRSAMVWLGEADPCDTIERARDSDPKLEGMREVLTAWKAVIGAEKVTTGTLIAMATKVIQDFHGVNSFEFPALHDALLTVGGKNGKIDMSTLGNWLGGHKDKPVNGLILKKVKIEGYNRWCVTPDSKPAPTPDPRPTASATPPAAADLFDDGAPPPDDLDSYGANRDGEDPAGQAQSVYIHSGNGLREAREIINSTEPRQA